ncbi:hypothetical protein NQ317_008451 [Molorchus minor]|uniref:V-type proton ATPase subunit S1 n=1 Tax=Molorchus minor TaxID=1323400 RepID=A0ABQ9JHU3_9CUCU|nr:hypothetical protein NQ317_008451 [Molorchus minor]
MSGLKCVLVFVSLFFIINSVQSTEFVPVYMWSTSKANEKVPALHKISQDSFKDDLLERLKENPFVIVFAEQTLSPEDFAQRDQSGGIVFPNLSKLKKSSKVTYLPYVQNPLRALKHLDEEVTELSIGSLKESLEIPETNILIIDLNDAKDDEHRLDMLKRHDADISSIYAEILKKHDNVLVLYTGRHTSWVAPEGVVNSRKIRSLLAINSRTYFNTTYALIYYTNITVTPDKSVSTNKTVLDLTFTDTKTNDTILLTGEGSGNTVNFTFSQGTGGAIGYWQLTGLVANYSSSVHNLTSSISDIYAPYSPTSFSYHCGDQVFTDSANFELDITYFQVQPFFNGTGIVTRFSDAYDCVGFTSVPIWSGLFVSSILLLIMTFGLVMIMDIRTMDKFDDPKGKTITITTE